MTAARIRAALACALAATTVVAGAAPAAGHPRVPGGVVVTGHDPDYHAARGGNATGAQDLLRRAVAYATRAARAPRMLLITDLRDPGGDNRDPRLGLAAAGFSGFDVADTVGAGDVHDVHDVDFRRYDVIIVASDYGGWLREDETAVLAARRRELLRFVRRGGGLVVLAESGGRPTGGDPAIHPGITSGRLAFLPALARLATPVNQREVGFTLTPAGLAMGLVPDDVNGDPPNVSHVVFTGDAGYDVIDRDAAGRIVTLATHRRLRPDGRAGHAPRCAGARGRHGARGKPC